MGPLCAERSVVGPKTVLSASHTESFFQSPTPISIGKVLLADDDPIFRHLVKTWLTRWNYRVSTVDSGLAAWELLQREDPAEMLILDGMMPGLNGADLCRKVRNQPNSRYRYIILLTANDHQRDIVAGLDAGADDYLTKPFDAMELRARIRAGRRILDLQEALLKAQGDLRYQAEHDALTGLLNRGAIMSVLHKEVKRRERTGGQLGVLMADVDHFKQVNDAYGHLAGDTVLREVGQRLTDALRFYDSVGRYGGEEFLAILPGCNPADLAASAERLRFIVARDPVLCHAGPISVTLSLGGACAAQPEIDESELLLRRADSRLYKAKTNGRNRVELTD
jgi:diguanylate cyclase (GGDEF)-like protein